MANYKTFTSLVLILCLFIGLMQFRETWAYGSNVLPGGEEGSDYKISADLRDQIRSLRSYEVEGGEDRVRVILQLKHKDRSRIEALLYDQSISAGDELKSLNSRVVELPVKKLRRIAASDDVAYISLDRELQPLGHIEVETGIAQMRLGNGNSGIEGKDIGIAIVDSGVYKGHHSLGGRIDVKLDFTGGGVFEED